MITKGSFASVAFLFRVATKLNIDAAADMQKTMLVPGEV
jgi:hypothetical protein